MRQRRRRFRTHSPQHSTSTTVVLYSIFCFLFGSSLSNAIASTGGRWSDHSSVIIRSWFASTWSSSRRFHSGFWFQNRASFEDSRDGAKGKTQQSSLVCVCVYVCHLGNVPWHFRGLAAAVVSERVSGLRGSCSVVSAVKSVP